MSLSDDLNAIPTLFGDVVAQLGKLVQNETELARAELSQKITEAGIGAAYVTSAAILAVPVLVILLMALALWLTQLGLAPAVAYLAAAACGAMMSVVLAFVGMSYLKPENLKPKITLREIRRDVTAAKELAR